MTKKVIFWQKVFIQTNKKGKKVPIHPVLISCSAMIIENSELICGICREKEVKHSRPRRRHKFQQPIGGLTLDVTYNDGQVHRRYNVQQAKKANCWTEDK